MLWVLKVHIKQKDRATGQVVWFSHYVTEIKRDGKNYESSMDVSLAKGFHCRQYRTLLDHFDALNISYTLLPVGSKAFTSCGNSNNVPRKVEA